MGTLLPGHSLFVAGFLGRNRDPAKGLQHLLSTRALGLNDFDHGAFAQLSSKQCQVCSKPILDRGGKHGE